MSDHSDHYLKTELYELVRNDSSIFEFLQLGSLDGIWYWDITDPAHEWMSERFWQVLGHDPAERQHLAEEWQDMIFEEDLALALENFEKHCEDPDHPYDQIVRYRAADGSTVWVRCRGIAIRDQDGTPIRMLGAHTDVTKQKVAEERLARRTAELEKANRELRAALDEIDLLEGLLPVCAHCKRIRDNGGDWKNIELYISQRTPADFTHAICDDCAKRHYNYVPE